jgi:hypothetical protein
MSEELENEQGGPEVDPELEQEAISMGWTPKEKFRGNPDKWIDAATFVERGKQVLPILQANYNRMKNDLLTRDREIGNLKQQLETTSALVRDMATQFSERLQQELAAQRRDLKAQLKEAVADRDVDAELEIRDQLTQLDQAEREAQERVKKNKDKLQAKTATDTDPQPQLSEEFMEWREENPWYGGNSPEDRKRTKALTRIAEDLREDGETSTGRAFLDLCLQKLQEREEGGKGSGRPSTSKVEGGNPRGNAGGGVKGWEGLPADAKAACDEFAQDLVGPDKVYKTLKEFREYYVKHYYGS